MGKNQFTFKRYEMKYLISDQQYSKLRQLLKEEMQVDEYGLTTICNIYFDTPDYRLIRTSLEKPVYKEKLRLRSYGTPTEQDTVFIELKKKYKGIVYKRREKMSLAAAEQYLYKDQPAQKSSQIMNEIDWFLKSYKNLEPAMYISYDRIAMYGVEDPNLRITFDCNIQWRDEELYLGSGIWGSPILEEGQKLMEIKISETFPLWLAHILAQLEIYPASFSKYGRGYQIEQQRIRNKKTKGVKKYA